jgi:hypothetical protein
MSAQILMDTEPGTSLSSAKSNSASIIARACNNLPRQLSYNFVEAPQRSTSQSVAGLPCRPGSNPQGLRLSNQAFHLESSLGKLTAFHDGGRNCRHTVQYGRDDGATTMNIKFGNLRR